MAADSNTLPKKAVTALADGDVATAMRILREESGMDPESARTAVEDHLAAHPPHPHDPAYSPRNAMRLILGAVLAALLAALLFFIAHG